MKVTTKAPLYRLLELYLYCWVDKKDRDTCECERPPKEI